ncbi:MAG: hypothetical protein M1812_003293 [Candelaria pacifica]|nr:MAG: hypothetical protein M1812_003293 [Candelaria pacifica]
METSSTALALPKVSRKSFIDGNMTILIYTTSMKAMNPDKILDQEEVFESYKNEVTKLFAGDAGRLAFFLDQLKSPEAWRCWNELEIPPRGYFGVDHGLFFHCIRPRTAHQKKTRRIKMISNEHSGVLAPYYGFEALENVRYGDVWNNTWVHFKVGGACLTAEEVIRSKAARDTSTPRSIKWEAFCMRQLIDNVYLGIIYNEFHFRTPEEQYRAYILGFRGSGFEPREGVNMRKPLGMEEPVLYPSLDEQQPPATELHEDEPSITHQHDLKVNAKRKLETDEEDDKGHKSQKLAADVNTTEESASSTVAEAPTFDSPQEEISWLRGQLQAARQQPQQQSIVDGNRKPSMEAYFEMLAANVAPREVTYRADHVLRAMRMCRFEFNDDDAEVIRDFLLGHDMDAPPE